MGSNREGFMKEMTLRQGFETGKDPGLAERYVSRRMCPLLAGTQG